MIYAQTLTRRMPWSMCVCACVCARARHNTLPDGLWCWFQCMPFHNSGHTDLVFGRMVCREQCHHLHPVPSWLWVSRYQRCYCVGFTVCMLGVLSLSVEMLEKRGWMGRGGWGGGGQGAGGVAGWQREGRRPWERSWGGELEKESMGGGRGRHLN